MSIRKTSAVTAIILMITVTVVYATFDPTLPWFPRCLFKQLTGFDCPGCGSQRALHALLTGHPIDALRYNFLIFILVPTALVVALTEVKPERWPRLYRTVHSGVFILSIAAIISAWWILRNVP